MDRPTNLPEMAIHVRRWDGMAGPGPGGDTGLDPGLDPDGAYPDGVLLGGPYLTRPGWPPQLWDAVDCDGWPEPDRPAGVPEHARWVPQAEQWTVDRWTSTVPRVGIRVYWDTAGEPVQVEYHRRACVARVGIHNDGDPLVEAARDGADTLVDALLTLGLGRSPGAALHAAYAGLPELARRLRDQPGEPAPGGITDPRLAPPRRPEVAADARWIAGIGTYGAWQTGAVDPDTCAAEGLWRLWIHRPHLDHDEYVETTFGLAGPQRRRRYGTVRWRQPDDRTHVDGFLLEEETTWAPLTRRRFDGGRLDTETRHNSDGTVTTRRFRPDGTLEVSRRTRDDVLVAEEWFDDQGITLARVFPVADEPDVELFTAVDTSGTRLAWGHVEAGPDGGPVGRWTLAGRDGTGKATTTFEPLAPGRRGDLGRLAHLMHVWHETPAPAALSGSRYVPWAELNTFFGSAEHFPFLLKGITVPDEQAPRLAVAEMYDAVVHQGSIEDAAGPTARFLVAALGAVRRPALALEPMRLLIMMATREGELSAAHALKRLHRAVQRENGAAQRENGAAGHYAAHDTEPAYHAVFNALATATPLWTQWAAHPLPEVRHRALLLLALAPGERAAAALCARVTVESDPVLRADALLGLALHEPGDELRTVLTRHLADDDPLPRFCAALTWLRHRLPTTGPEAGLRAGAAAGVLGAALVDPAGLERYDQLLLRAGDAQTDAATTIALLPAEQAERHLAGLCTAIDEVDPLSAAGVARAALDVVFPVEAYEPGAELTPTQRAVLGVIADSDNVWTFDVNAFEVLGYHGLPTDREMLAAVAADRPLPARGYPACHYPG